MITWIRKHFTVTPPTESIDDAVAQYRVTPTRRGLGDKESGEATRKQHPEAFK